MLPPSRAMDKTKLDTRSMWRKQPVPSACVFQSFRVIHFAWTAWRRLKYWCFRHISLFFFFYFRHDSLQVEHLPSETLLWNKSLRKGTWEHAANTAVKINTNPMWCVYWYNNLPSNKVTYGVGGCWQLFWGRNIRYFLQCMAGNIKWKIKKYHKSSCMFCLFLLSWAAERSKPVFGLVYETGFYCARLFCDSQRMWLHACSPVPPSAQLTESDSS